METIKTLADKLQEITLPIYLGGHINPDDDSIGSNLSLAYLLKSMGKNVKVMLEDIDKPALKLHDIEAEIVEIVEEENYVFIALDLNETYRLGRFEKYYLNAPYKINIDHHQGNNTNADFILSMPDVSSTCEIIYNLVNEINKDLINIQLAKSLYTGILTDTKSFSKRLSPNTLTIVQDLINQGIDYDEIIRNTMNRRTIYQFQAFAKLIQNINYDDYHYAILDKELPEYKDLTHNEIVKILAEEIRKLEGVDTFMLLIKYPTKITGKVMSNITKNAHVIAKYFGGGGHKQEAGFTTNKSIEEILEETKQFIK